MPSICQRNLAILAGAFLCAGQEAGTPTFRGGTTLIEFNVVALDARGNPVTDLKKVDIRVTELGQPRDVAFFRFEGAGGSEEIPHLPPGEFTNRSERRGSFRPNVTAIALDTINTAPVGGLAGLLQESTYQNTARAQVLRYLHAFPANTKAALYRMEDQKITVLQDFTGDAESLRARIAGIDLNLRGQQIDIGFDPPPDAGGTAAAGIAAAAEGAQRALSYYNDGVRDDRLAATLASLESLGSHLAGMPGRKSIVWISVGMPVITNTDGWRKSYAPAIQRTARRLASQGIAVYGLPIIEAAKYNPTMDMLAETTGGRVVRGGSNDPTEGLTAAAADNGAVYTVAFYSAGEPDNKWHDVSLKVDRPGISLDYRQGYLSEAPAVQPQEWSRGQWRAAIYSSLGSGNLRMDARCRMGSGQSAGMVFVTLKFELSDLLFREANQRRSAQIEIAFVEIKSNQTYNIQRSSATLGFTESNGGAVQHTHSWKLDPQAMTIRVILRDKRTGRYGTLDIPAKDIPGRQP